MGGQLDKSMKLAQRDTGRNDRNCVNRRAHFPHAGAATTQLQRTSKPVGQPAQCCQLFSYFKRNHISGLVFKLSWFSKHSLVAMNTCFLSLILRNKGMKSRNGNELSHYFSFGPVNIALFYFHVFLYMDMCLWRFRNP